MTAINELRSKVCKQAYLLIKRGYSQKDAMRKAWTDQKFIVEYAKKIIQRNKIEAVATTWTPNPEAMAAYYSSNCYKGD